MATLHFLARCDHDVSCFPEVTHELLCTSSIVKINDLCDHVGVLLWVSGSQAILDCKVCCLVHQNAPRCVPSHTVSHSFTVTMCQVYLHFVWLLVTVHQHTGLQDLDQLKETSGTENTGLTNIECFEPLLWP